MLLDREQIARDLNAGVIHTLFGIGLHLQSAAANAPDDGVRRVMEEAVEEIDLAITQLRQDVFRSRSAEARP